MFFLFQTPKTKEMAMLKKINTWLTKLYVRQDILQHELRQTIANQRGAGAVEYALVIAVVVTMVVAAAAVMRDPLEEFFKAIIAKVRSIFGI